MVEPLVLNGGMKKVWYFLNNGDGSKYFTGAFVNMKESCRMRIFDADTGRFLRRQNASGEYQNQFARYLTEAQQLIVHRQLNLELLNRSENF